MMTTLNMVSILNCAELSVWSIPETSITFYVNYKFKIAFKVLESIPILPEYI